MITQNKANFKKNAEGKSITVTRDFDAPVDEVWSAWTTAEKLDQWWGPQPWKAITRSLDFREGGSWIYKMQGPNGEAQWDKVEFTSIDAPRRFTARDFFIDQNGQETGNMPSSKWNNTFTATGNGTKIVSELTYNSKEDMDKIISTGFEQGFSTGLDQLDELLSK